VIPSRTLPPQTISLIAFGLALVLAWFSYYPALGGEFQFDDRGNIGDLEWVEDASTAVDFILAGEAGPLGRPLALLSFALQADSWDQDPAAFLAVNIGIHLLNALVLAWCLYRIGLLRGISAEKATIAAVAAASIWVTMPLLATASLLIVQRMTTLSALFLLLGLAGYLEARRGLAARPQRALVLMSASLAAGTLCAALAKESGLLLPVFVLVLECTLLERPASVPRGRWSTWFAVFLVLPLVLVVGYLARLVDYPESLVLRRGFDAGERLMTEAGILWTYLHKALIGIPGRLGIYQPAPEPARTLLAPATLAAVISWLALLIGAIVWRRRFPLVAFAVLWFLAGHLVESTLVPLELYFEHRNYLPIAGPVFAAASAWVLCSRRTLRVAAAAIPVYVLASAYLLHGFASLWGEPSLAARYWAMRYPDSHRAVSNLAGYQLREEGPLRALQTIDQFVLENPEHAYMRIPELNLRCRYLPAEDHGLVVEQLLQGLPEATFTYTAGGMLSELLTTVSATDCNGVGPDTLLALAESLRGNPRYARDSRYNQFHNKLLAAIARRDGDYDGAIEALRRAIAYAPSSELNMMMVTALADTGDFDAAREFIDDALQQGPRHPLKALRWRRDLEGLQAYIRELEKQAP
jgi:tetratricopeptide (TPR) repeat protein